MIKHGLGWAGTLFWAALHLVPVAVVLAAVLR
jgi:hypothetical protein